MKNIIPMIVALLAIFVCCSQPTSESSAGANAGTKPYFICTINCGQYPLVGSPTIFCAAIQCQCYHDPLLQVLSIRLDNLFPDTTDCPSSDFENGETWAFARYKNPSLGAKELTILTTDGIATASVVLPESTSFYCNKDRDTISSDSDVVFKWNSTSDWYELYIDVADTSGTNQPINMDTVLTDTTYTIQKSRISPTAIFIRATVYGTNGPFPNDKNGNIAGAGSGFVNATNVSYSGKYTVLHFFR
jgi:hypothetical protein